MLFITNFTKTKNLYMRFRLHFILYVFFICIPIFAVAQSPIITTIAGTGRNGHTGDGGPALTADILGPVSIRFDDSGNYYFAEKSIHVVRKVSR